MISLSALHIYPIKSCGGISVPQARVDEPGLALDRHWMLIDRQGRFLSQREYPLMAAIRTALNDSVLSVQTDGMSELRLPLQADPTITSTALPVTIWQDNVAALDCGEHAHQWFSSYLGVDARLVRFAPSQQRICSPRWTGPDVATTQFADGFPLLVVGEASLQDLNQRMEKKGAPAIPMDRFRPNLVLSGLEAYEEDYVDTLSFGEPGHEVVIRMVKPCARCPIPTINQDTGLSDPLWGNEPLDTMSAYRANQRVEGGLTFGQNAIVIQGAGNLLRVGQSAQVELNF